MNAPQTSRFQLVRGQVLHFLADPGEQDDADSYQYFRDGALWIVDGHIADLGPWVGVQARVAPEDLAAAEVFNYGDRLILPGLVDTHCHYPQSGIIASFGRQLLDWLNDYTFPAEAAFGDPAVGAATAEYFIERMLAHGTTTASVFSTVHPESVDAFMAAAKKRDLRMLTGKVMMDRNAPANLMDTVAEAERDCLALIERWHGKGRLRYSITPRFAPTSSPEQLALAGELYKSKPDLHVQSHLAENPAEIAWVGQLFPHCRDYAATTSTSISVTACSARARSTATASTSRPSKSRKWPATAPRRLSARPPTSSSAAASSITRRRPMPASASGWPPMSAAVPHSA